jgi:hypothetical protein
MDRPLRIVLAKVGLDDRPSKLRRGTYRICKNCGRILYDD